MRVRLVQYLFFAEIQECAFVNVCHWPHFFLAAAADAVLVSVCRLARCVLGVAGCPATESHVVFGDLRIFWQVHFAFVLDILPSSLVHQLCEVS